MATIVLSAVGAALGSSIGGGILGLSAVAIGRAVGAIAGTLIDQAVMGDGSDAVETGPVDRIRLNGVSEGAAIRRAYGSIRLGGQVIWTSPVRQTVGSDGSCAGGSGKGTLLGGSAPQEGECPAVMSLAVALCEGEISHVGRVWADGVEMNAEALNMRVYRGTETQAPDPKIEAEEGAGNAPAYRGTAYVVIEDLDVTAFGKRVPVFNFEVFRPEGPDQPTEIARGTKAVAIIPGTGEYALATTPVHYGDKPGESYPANEHTPFGKTDFAVSLDTLEGELPNLEAASLVVSWFGDDLRCGACEIAPKVEKHDEDGHEMPWRVSGLARAGAGLVPFDADRPVYGGTPADQSVIEAISALKDAGKAVTFYPFILMTQMAGNGLADPWSDTPDQPALPWRGRITLSVAPGREGSPDGSAGAQGEVSAFFGSAQPADFSVSGGTVQYAGPNEWSYRRFILHYAHLCKAAGGVEAFLIGSELRSLTQIRGAGGSFPAVGQLVQLAADVRAVLGPEVKISYAADWSEYFGYHPQDGSGDVYFHLDALWSDDNIDFIGIDNYMPLSDWRDGDSHADAHWGSIYNLDYLKANILGGEGYDWYYHAPEAADVQRRTEIRDEAHGEPWVWRYKDIVSWWQKGHFERVGGLRSSDPTSWVPGSKPIWFTEMGCAAVDKGTNQPNKFVDPKSSESSLPAWSNGQRDDFIQRQYLRAMGEFWSDPAHNPTDPETGVQMLDMSRAHVWAWDARPFPWFPGLSTVWSDSANYGRGHWLNGRAASRSLASVVEEICAASGVAPVDTSRLYGVVRGYVVDHVTGARNALQPLMLAYGFEAAERDGQLVFFSRTGLAGQVIDHDRLALVDEIDGVVEYTRVPEPEVAGRVRLNFIEAGSDYGVRATEAIFPDAPAPAVSTSELSLVLTGGEARAIAERWLAEARVARDKARFALPPSGLWAKAGDVVELDLPEGAGNYRLDHIEQAGVAMVQAVRIEPSLFEPVETLDLAATMSAYVPPVPVLPLFLDLPLLTGDEVPHAPHLAVTARPWTGPVAVYRAPQDDGYSFALNLPTPARVGLTQSVLARARPGLFDRGPALRVRMTSGDLASATPAQVLNGANAAVIGDGTSENWEVFQFTDAVLVEPGVWEITGRLRGQAGSDAIMPEAWPVGSWVVMLDGALDQVPLALSHRGLERHYRIGPAARGYDDPSYVHTVQAFNGIGLRPLAPVHLAATPGPGGDLSVSWVRRTRIDGDSWLAEEVPLGEDSERYRVRVMAGLTVLREETVDGPGWSYSAAMQAADGAAAPFAVEVAQVSGSFGPGPYRRIEVAL